MQPDNLHKKRHSLAHVLAAAILNLYPETKLTIGPAIDNGFYYDVDCPTQITEKDLTKIENKMREIMKKWTTFERQELSEAEAKQLFANNPYKLELIAGILEKGEKITTYKSGDFVDLCMGGHVDNMKEVESNSFKLDRVAGAYWRGDEKNKMLTRIYGLAFDTKEDLEKYIWQQEEAKKRDHKKLGRELKIFTISPLVGSGLPLLQPNGMTIRKELEEYLWSLHKDNGYERVWTPHVAHEKLYETSGHAAKFGDELFRVQGKEEKFILKPMNCPHHMQIFADNQFSYKDMPVRYFEPATVYRDEKSGQLAGLTRVRSITQDDGHLFCTVGQIGTEVSTIVGIIKKFYTSMNLMNDYWVRLSVRGEDKSLYLGSDEVWNKAEKALEDAAKENKLNYKLGPGEAAFYGPKLDFMFKDAIGREWQLATIQCDFNLPERFELSFVNDKGEKERPVVIHRAICGSFERFMGIIIEHYAGNFPVWLSPTQIKIIPVRENHNDYAKKVATELRVLGVRVDLDATDEGMGKKIRAGKNMKVPYMLVIGDKEIESGELALEIRDGAKQEKITLGNLKDKLSSEIKNRS